MTLKEIWENRLENLKKIEETKDPRVKSILWENVNSCDRNIVDLLSYTEDIMVKVDNLEFKLSSVSPYYEVVKING